MTERDSKNIAYSKIVLNDYWGATGFAENTIDQIDINRAKSEISKRIRDNTIFFLFLNLIFAALTPILFERNHSSLIAISILAGIFWIIFFIVSIIFVPRYNPSCEITDEKLISFTQSLKGLKSFFFYLRPFRFQYVWFWILIIGVVSAVADYIPKASQDGKFTEMLISIGKSLLIMILAYIASNIIRELLSLRDDYSKSAKDFTNIKSELTKASSQVQELRRTLDLKEIDDKYKEFIDHLNDEDDPYEILEQTKNEFKSSLKSLFDSFDNKITKNSLSDFWLLSGLANDIKISSELFKSENLIVTKFEIFAELLKNSLQALIAAKQINSRLDFEIFTTIVLPPDRFFNYSLKKEEQKKWQDYLNINRIATQNGINQHRHFISFTDAITTLEYNSKKFVRDSNDEDIKPLIKQSFREKLNKYLEFGNDGLLKIEEDYSYKLCDENFGQCKKLSEAIKQYHCPDCAKVMEINLNDNNVKSFFNILIDEKTLKPVDYYAIRQGNDWVFCFKAIYDNSYNTAALFLYNSKNAQWNTITNELNTLFTSMAVSDMTADTEQKNKLTAVRSGITVSQVDNY
jgi:hypothetical protein